jgi:putative PIN family toxin of toxin-antitoxin system
MEKSSNVRVVIDTNVIISAFISGGKSLKILDYWRKGNIVLVVSNTILQEYQDVLSSKKIRNKYKISLFNIELFIKDIMSISYFVNDNILLDRPLIRSRDQADDIFISCALVSNCKYLISGDKDVLAVRNNKLLGGLKIITPSEFIETYP